jgi:hypothetical protein
MRYAITNFGRNLTELRTEISSLGQKKEENLKKLRTVFKTDLWGRDQICIVWQRLGSKSFFLVSRGPIGFELQTHCSADRVPRMVNQFLRNSSGSESVVTFCNLLAII